MENRKVIELTLPFPPSVNHYWRHRAIGHNVSTYISTQGKAFRQAVCAYIRGKGLDYGIDAPVAVSVVLRPPNRARRDLDNYGGKALLDALTHAGVWLDDHLVGELNLKWGAVLKGGEALVTISPLEGE